MQQANFVVADYDVEPATIYSFHTVDAQGVTYASTSYDPADL